MSKIIKLMASNGGDKGFVYKSATVFGVSEDNVAYPLFFLRRPKWIGDDGWERIVNAVLGRFELFVNEADIEELKK